MKKFKIFYKDKNKLEAKKLIKFLLNQNFIEDNKNPDFLVSVGGDGTAIYSMRYAIFNNLNVPLLNFNLGGLGFLMPFEVSEYAKTLTKLKNKKLDIKEISVFECFIDDKKDIIINDISIINPLRAIKPNVYINNVLISNQKLTGYLISTAIGSTAFNNSLDGPIFLDSSKQLILKPIAPIHNKIFYGFNNSLIIDETNVIHIDFNNEHNLISIDGINNYENIKKIKITKITTKIQLYVKDKNTFLIDNIIKKIL